MFTSFLVHSSFLFTSALNKKCSLSQVWFFPLFAAIICIFCLTKELISESTCYMLAKWTVVIIIQIKLSYTEISMLAQILGLSLHFFLSLSFPWLYHVSSQGNLPTKFSLHYYAMSNLVMFLESWLGLHIKCVLF